MYLAHKPIDQITEDDLQGLVDQRAQEGETVEFKSDMWGSSDGEKREMLRDIVSLANRRGGEIYIGIGEDDGTAVSLGGVEGEGLPERIIQSCRANIEPSLQLQAHPVLMNSGRIAIIVRVPASLIGPHMITHSGLNQFWVRHGKVKARMIVEEIEEAFMRRFEGETRLEHFVEERQRAEFNTAHGCLWLSLMATPIHLRTNIVDINDPNLRALLTRPPDYSGASFERLETGTPRPTLEGLRAQISATSSDTRRVLEIHRNGHLHFGVRLAEQRDPDKSIPSLTVAALTYDFTHLARDVYQMLAVAGPVGISLAILNASSAWLGVRGSEGRIGQVTWGQGDLLSIPTIFAGDISGEMGRVVKEANDQLWNAFGLEGCQILSDDGEFVR